MKAYKLLLVMMAIVFWSCESQSEDETDDDSIIGKWKLKTVELVFVAEKHDYSKYNIVYEFQSNNILKVSGATDLNIIELYRGMPYGEYSYSIMINDNGVQYIKIGSINTAYGISNKTLVLSTAPLDGPIQTLTKIK